MSDVTTPIPFDYHSHNRRCGHAVGELRAYIEKASALGMSEFGVSDHSPAYWLPGDHAQPGTQMAISWLPGYVEEAIALKQELAGQIAVRVGLEADFIEGYEAELAALLDAHPFDYVLGSVHYALGRTIFRRDWHTLENPDAVFAEYYRLIASAARSGLFDILSHLTAVEAYSPPLPDEVAAKLYPPVADAVAESGCLVEVNTSGFRKIRAEDGGPGNEPFPNRRMLRLLIERRVPLTFGSDCHHPDEVGYGSAGVFRLLQELGLDPTKTEPHYLSKNPKRDGTLRRFSY